MFNPGGCSAKIVEPPCSIISCGDRIRSTHVDAVKEGVALDDVLLEQHDVLENLFVDLHAVEVPDGVFAQEIEDEVVRRLARDVLVSQRATAHGVCLVVALLVASSQRKAVDEVHGRRTLSFDHDFVSEVGRVVRTNAIDVILGSWSEARLEIE